MRHIPLVVTNTNKRAMDIDVHYRQILNQKLGPVNDRNNGWFAGGRSFGSVSDTLSSVDRSIFSNDTTTALRVGNLQVARTYGAGTGNFTDGWVGGGANVSLDTVSSRVDRIIFSQDGSSALLRGQLSLQRGFFSSVGNTTDGWFVGGTNQVQISSNALSTVDRVIFAADLSNANSRNPLPVSRNGHFSVSNTSAGWIFGGYDGTNTLSSTVRLTFANDTQSMSTRGNLLNSREGSATLWNTTSGWIISGEIVSGPSIIGVTSIERIIFASDTSSTTLRGNTTTVMSYSASGQQNATDGWIGGSQQNERTSNSLTLSNIERLNFNNDTSIMVRRGQLQINREGPAGP